MGNQLSLFDDDPALGLEAHSDRMPDGVEAQAWLKNPEKAFSEWISSAGANGTRRYTENSITVYSAMWGKFVHYARGAKAAAALADVKLVEGFASSLKGSNPDRLRRRYLALIDKVQQHLIDLQVRTDRSAELVLQAIPPEDRRPTPVALPEDSVQRLQKTIDERPRQTWREARDHALVDFVLATGVKVAHIRTLTVDALTLDGKLPSVTLTHRRQSTTIPLSERTTDILRKWRVIRDGNRIPGTLLFPSTLQGTKMSKATIYRAVAHMIQGAELDHEPRHQGPQVLRHTFATRQLRNGRGIMEVSHWLLHRTLQSTMVYRELVPSPKPRPQ